MRLIDADKEIEELKKMKVEGEVFTTAVNFAMLILKNAPTVNNTTLSPIDITCELNSEKL